MNLSFTCVYEVIQMMQMTHFALHRSNPKLYTHLLTCTPIITHTHSTNPPYQPQEETGSSIPGRVKLMTYTIDPCRFLA